MLWAAHGLNKVPFGVRGVWKRKQGVDKAFPSISPSGLVLTATAGDHLLLLHFITKRETSGRFIVSLSPAWSMS